MRLVFELLGPIFLLVALGAALQRGGFFGAGAITCLNRLCYWVALPGLIVASLMRGGPGAGMGWAAWEGNLLGVLGGVTVALAAAGWVVAAALRLEWRARGTFTQAFFRGNLAFVGLPILLKFPGLAPQRVLLLLAPMMILYNLLAVGVLVVSWQGAGQVSWRTVVAEWLRNPILWASVLGGVAYSCGWVLPSPFDETATLIGKMAVPLALVTIGAVLTSLPTGAWCASAWVAMAGKNLLSPLVGWVVAAALGISGVERLLILVALACPTAVASYTMAEAMGGDEALAAQTVVGSTVGSAAVLAFLLAWAG